MDKATYSVTLDIKKVERAKVLFQGEKLSPLLNDLLGKWIKQKEKQNNGNNNND